MLLDLLLASAFISQATTVVSVLPGALRAPGPLSVGLGTLALAAAAWATIAHCPRRPNHRRSWVGRAATDGSSPSGSARVELAGG